MCNVCNVWFLEDHLEGSAISDDCEFSVIDMIMKKFSPVNNSKTFMFNIAVFGL